MQVSARTDTSPLLRRYSGGGAARAKASINPDACRQPFKLRDMFNSQLAL